MSRVRSSFVLVAACLACMVCVTSCADSTLTRQIYTTYVNQGYCVRLADQTGVIGCGLPKDGLSGRIRSALDAASLASLVAENPSDRVSLLLGAGLLTRDTLDAISALDIAGIMLMPTDTSETSGPVPPAGGYSPATRSPQLLPYIPPSAAIPEAANTTTLFNNSYEWNPTGEDIMHESFPYAIVTVTDAERAHLLSLAAKNEEDVSAGRFAPYVADFHFHMYASDSTSQCLSDGTCMPVGGYSVWGSLGNLTTNSSSSTRPFLLLTTKMDSTAFFHQMSPGADDSQASLAVLVAAVRVLANTPGVGHLPTQILYAAFDGESYSHVGSRKFVDDLQNFECSEYGTTPECVDPYKNTLDFENVKVSQISQIIEVGQIGLNSSVVLHRQRDGNVVTDQLIETVRAVAANMSSPLTIASAAADTPGIPPSCAEAFLDARESIGTVVLADHSGPFANAYYQSEFDGASNLITDAVAGSATLQHANLCSKATLLARTAWVSAGGDVDASRDINADCDFIDQFLTCMLTDVTCDLVTSLASAAYGSGTPSFPSTPHYTSVYNLLPESYIGGTPLFLYALFESWSLNATDYVPAPAGVTDWPSAPRNVHFHDAVDPNLVFDLAAAAWNIKPNANDRRLYTESNWDNTVRWRTYRREDPHMEVITFVSGIAVAVGTIIVVALLQPHCRKRCKRL